MDDDGPPLKAADGTNLDVRELKTVNPNGPLPTLLRLAREGRLTTHRDPIPPEVFNPVLGPDRETPKALATRGSFPTDRA